MATLWTGRAFVYAKMYVRSGFRNAKTSRKNWRGIVSLPQKKKRRFGSASSTIHLYFSIGVLASMLFCLGIPCSIRGGKRRFGSASGSSAHRNCFTLSVRLGLRTSRPISVFERKRTHFLVDQKQGIRSDMTSSSGETPVTLRRTRSCWSFTSWTVRKKSSTICAFQAVPPLLRIHPAFLLFRCQETSKTIKIFLFDK